MALKLAGLAGAVLPLFIVAALLCRRIRQKGPISETLLAAMMLVPLALLAEVFLLGYLPFGRPLDWLPLLHGLAWAGCTVWLVARRVETRAALGDARARLARVRRSLSPAQRAVVWLGVAAFVGPALLGTWTAPIAADAAEYHVPQAIQPWQDGRLGPVQTQVVYADSYPRGAALLFYWTMAMTRTDAGFDLVNAWFGAAMVLATYSAGRRMGLRRSWALCAGAMVPAAPIFGYLLTIKYIDMSAFGCCAAAIALALPERPRAGEGRPAGLCWSRFSAVVCALALVLAMWMKFLPIAVVSLVGACRAAVAFRQWLGTRRGNPAPAGNIRGSWLVGLGLAGGALAAIPYLHTWVRYGSPVWPFRLEIGPLVVFDGPMGPAQLGIEAFGSWLNRYNIFWTHWDAPLLPQSPGSLGPLFAVIMLPALIAAVLGTVLANTMPAQSTRGARRSISEFPTTGWLLLGGVLLLVLALPQMHWPRYSIYVLLPGAVGAAWLVSSIARREVAMGLCAVVGLLQAMGIGLFWTSTAMMLRDTVGSGSAPLFSSHRQRAAIDEDYREDARGPSAATRRVIYSLMPPGATLVSCVMERQALLHDADYGYRVEYRPAARRNLWADPSVDLAAGAENAAAWLQGLRRDGVHAVLVYKGSTEDATLAGTGSGYRLQFEQPTSDGVFVARVWVKESAP